MSREYDVERARSEGWIGGIADDEPNRSTRGVRLDLSLLQHCGGQVDADNFMTGLGHKNSERPGAAPEVDDGARKLRQPLGKASRPRRADPLIRQAVVRLVVERRRSFIPVLRRPMKAAPNLDGDTSMPCVVQRRTARGLPGPSFSASQLFSCLTPRGRGRGRDRRGHDHGHHPRSRSPRALRPCRDLRSAR